MAKMTEPDADTFLDNISKEADRIEEDCLISGKSQLNTSDIWRIWHYGLGIPATILAALAAADLLDGSSLSQFSAALAACVFAISTFLNPSEKSSAHQVAGNQYLALAKRVRRFREIDISSISEPDEVRGRLEELAQERDSLNESSPNPFQRSFNKARAGISAGEATYRADKVQEP